MRKNKKNIVIFLGAGASKSDGAPLQKELFKAYKESMKDLVNGSQYLHTHFSRRVKADLLRFFSSYFGIDLEEHQGTIRFPSFEEALGILEVEGEYAGRQKVEQYKEAIVASMSLAIEHQLEEKRTREDYQIIDSYHKRLIESLSKTEDYTVDFLSTNYDLLIDNALLSQQHKIDYAFGPGGQGTSLLKLHGSLNWLYCPHCKEMRAIVASKISVKNLLNFQEQECEVCHGTKSSVIIPPTYFKNFSQYGESIVNVWTKAYHLLHRADHIIFCGYSFPHADIHIKTLLKKAEQHRKGSPLYISVFNGYDGKSSVEMEKEQMRYRRFVKEETILDYHGDIPFEAFAQSPKLYFK